MIQTHPTPSPPDATSAAIETRGLTRYFGRKCAVDQVHMTVPIGSVFAMIGRNGSGKTTLTRMLVGMLDPTRGTAKVLGLDSSQLTPAVRARIGYMAEGHPVYGWMTAAESQRFQSGFHARWNRDIFHAVLSHFDIEASSKARSLSRGQRAGLSLALTLAAEPELLILDDPFMGLDPVARRSLLEAMIYFTERRDRTIFYSTHLLADVERVADQVAILDQSVLRACCTVERFRQSVRQYLVEFDGEPPPGLWQVPGLLQFHRGERDASLIVVHADDGMEDNLRAMGAATVEPIPLGLEDALTAYLGRRGERGFFLRTLGQVT